MTEQLTTKNIILLISGVLMTALAVTIYVVSNLGVSTVSSIPLVLNVTFPSISLGMTTIIFQAVLILILCMLYGLKVKYLVSMLLGVLFGTVVDVFFKVWDYIPLHALPNYITLLLALLLLPLGVSLAIRSKLTALPFDLIVSEIAAFQAKEISTIKIWFDVSCVITTLSLSVIFHQKIIGIGIGTIIATLLTGKLIQIFLKLGNKSLERTITK